MHEVKTTKEENKAEQLMSKIKKQAGRPRRQTNRYNILVTRLQNRHDRFLNRYRCRENYICHSL